jgi:hypothetical protein
MFGTYVVKLTNDGRGVIFSPQPTPLCILILLLYILFPSYILFLFLTLHIIIGNEKISNFLAPWSSESLHYLKLGTEMVIDKTKQMIHDLSMDENVHTIHDIIENQDNLDCDLDEEHDNEKKHVEDNVE